MPRLLFRLLRLIVRLQGGLVGIWLIQSAAKAALIRLQCKVTGRQCIVISLIQHMGDIVAAEPILRSTRAKYPECRLIWTVCPDFVDLVRHHPALDGVWRVSCLTEWLVIRKVLGKEHSLTLHLHGSVCGRFGIALDNPNAFGLDGKNYYHQGRNLLDAYCISAGILPLKESPKLYMPDDESARVAMNRIPQPLVVLHCVSNDSNRTWPAESFRALCTFILEQGWSVVEIGREGIIKIHSARFHDFCGKYNLAGYATCIRHAALFIGVDSGFAHFANALNIPAIILIGRFQAFSGHNPYSGDPHAERIILIHTDGPLTQLLADDVIRHVAARLETTLLKANSRAGLSLSSISTSA